MFRVDDYMHNLITLMKQEFGNRLLYVGLQGSYLRDEATENSDIDVMVILDNLSVKDLDSYRKIIMQMGQYEKSCGFICGLNEFSKWNPLELCHILHSTKDYYGNLSSILPQYSEQDINNYIKISLGNLYHEICHRYVHDDMTKNYERLPSSYKHIFFILQNIYYLRTGIFYQTKTELLQVLDNNDKEILESSISIHTNKFYDFPQAFKKLFSWCQTTLTGL